MAFYVSTQTILTLVMSRYVTSTQMCHNSRSRIWQGGGMASAECNPIMGSRGRSTGAHPGVGQGDKALRS